MHGDKFIHLVCVRVCDLLPTSTVDLIFVFYVLLTVDYYYYFFFIYRKKKIIKLLAKHYKNATRTPFPL